MTEDRSGRIEFSEAQNLAYSSFVLTLDVQILLLLHLFFFFSKDCIYLFMRNRDTERGRTQAEGGTGSASLQGARISRIMPWAEGGAKPLSHPGCPKFFFREGHSVLLEIY